MRFIISLIFIPLCVFGAYAVHGGHLGVLWQPSEVVIIVGAAFGSMFIANPANILKGAAKGLKTQFKGTPFKKDAYLELLCMMYHIFKVARSKGMLELESHIETPHESGIFKKYPMFQHNHHAEVFFCDYIRMLTMGVENHYQLEDMMNAELEIHHKAGHEAAMAVVNMGDGMPALGIVAAVLGVIHTMGSISEPPEVLGHLIGAALVGTFLGVLLSYGFIGPIGQFIGKFYDEEGCYFNAMKVGILAHVQGLAPQVSVEFARKQIPHHAMPTFKELEEAVQKVVLE
jgi:chemotaxis protein MotA